MSCEDSSSSSYENCECTTAAMMFEEGTLQCPDGSDDAPYCPSDCNVCDTCLSLLGCTETRPGSPIGTFDPNLMWMVIAALSGIILGLIAMTVHRRDVKDLEENLMEGEVGDAAVAPNARGENNVWLAPMS